MREDALFGVLAGIIAAAFFDGYGDTGQFGSLDAPDEHNAVALPEVDAASLPIAEVIEKLAYDFLDEVASSWGNNDFPAKLISIEEASVEHCRMRASLSGNGVARAAAVSLAN